LDEQSARGVKMGIFQRFFGSKEAHTPKEGAAALPSASAEWADGVGLSADQFVLIQPGTFQMGSTNGRSDESPVHTVNIAKAFYLQKTAVTQAQWEAVMGSRPIDPRDLEAGCSVEGDPQRPVGDVSWNDAQAFAEMLNGQIHGGGFRLPTEAEWE
jgi:formylglycine-generating enzyme required for sulfatase activity